MGAEPWSYFVPYRVDVEAALQELQQQEFEAGRYRFFGDPDHRPQSISEAVEACEAEGTGSILDMIGVGETLGGLDSEEPSMCLVCPLSSEQLIAIYGTETPSHDQVENGHNLYELLDRGLGAYVVVYDGDAPSELYFAGYSFD